MNKAIFEINFGEPEQGWLPVHIAYENFDFSFDASDVPIDPVSHLADILSAALNGGGGEVLWNLEPSGYFMRIASEEGNFRIQLDFCEDSQTGHNRTNMLNIIGRCDEIILPIWNALKRLRSSDTSDFDVSETVLDHIESMLNTW